MKEIVFDFEGDGLWPTKIHCVSYRDLETNKTITVKDHNEIRVLLEDEGNILIGHNIIRFDIPHLSRIVRCDVKCQLIDTLPLSWYLYPTMPKHGLDEWGNEVGVKKPKIDDWHGLTEEEYIFRCESDVEINTRIWNMFKDRLSQIYKGDGDKVADLIKYLNFKMRCAALAEKSGWKVDVKLLNRNIKILTDIKHEKLVELSAALPPIPITKTRTKPDRLYKKNGDLSEAGKRWADLTDKHGKPLDYEGELEEVVDYDPPNPNSHQQVKDWLFSIGWVPETYKQNPKGKEIPQIGTDDPDKKGELCQSVTKLIEVHPAVEALSGLFVLNHRIGLLEGLRDNLDGRGYVKAEIAGFTNTLRMKHKTVVNFPGVNKPYGEYVRSVLIAPEGFELCGSDMAALEDRTKQHYMWVWDPKYVEEMNKPGWDPHLDLAVVGRALTPDQVEDFKAMKAKKEKIPKELDVVRQKYKTGNYTCTYGAFPPKIAKTLKIPLGEARDLFDTYWKRNWSIKKIAESTKTNELVDGSKWLLNTVNGFYYSLRHEKDRFSTLNQGTGAYCFDVWLKCVLDKYPQLTAQFHDEGVWCIRKGRREEFEKLLRDSIEEANEILNLNRKLDIGVQFGDNYGQIH